MQLGVIFDLDQTLVDSWYLDDLRKRRKWSAVYARIHEMQTYEGISTIIQQVSRDPSLAWAIVTSSPASYAEKILEHFGWTPNALVGYHDTQRRKPHPDPILKAIKLLNVSSNRCISFGDHPKDMVASQKADVTCVACLWGAQNIQQLLASSPDLIITKPHEIMNTITLSM